MFRKPDGAGKGDAPRPIKDKEQFEKNWDAIFKKKEIDDTELKNDEISKQNNSLEPVLGGVLTTISDDGEST